MNKRDVTKLLFAVLIILVGVLGIQEYLQRVSVKMTQDEGEIFGQIENSSISQLQIQRGEVEYNLYKQDELWFVRGEKSFPAEKDIVDEILKGLQETRMISVASERQDKADIFETTKEKGIVLKMSYDNQEMIVTFGKSGPEYQSAYITISSTEKVLLVKTSLRTTLSQDEYRNKSIAQVPLADIHEVIIQDNNEQYTFTKEDSWMIDGQVGEQSKILSVIQEIESLRAMSILDQEDQEKYGFIENNQSIQVFDEAGLQVKIIFGSQVDGEVSLLFDDTYLYTISKEVFDKIMIPKQEFLNQ